jgi:hypothetical protein
VKHAWGKRRNTYTLLVEEPEEKNHLEDLGIDEFSLAPASSGFLLGKLSETTRRHNPEDGILQSPP